MPSRAVPKDTFASQGCSWEEAGRAGPSTTAHLGLLDLHDGGLAVGNAVIDVIDVGPQHLDLLIQLLQPLLLHGALCLQFCPLAQQCFLQQCQLLTFLGEKEGKSAWLSHRPTPTTWSSLSPAPCHLDEPLHVSLQVDDGHSLHDNVKDAPLQRLPLEAGGFAECLAHPLLGELLPIAGVEKRHMGVQPGTLCFTPKGCLGCGYLGAEAASA